MHSAAYTTNAAAPPAPRVPATLCVSLAALAALIQLPAKEEVEAPAEYVDPIRERLKALRAKTRRRRRRRKAPDPPSEPSRNQHFASVSLSPKKAGRRRSVSMGQHQRRGRSQSQSPKRASSQIRQLLVFSPGEGQYLKSPGGSMTKIGSWPVRLSGEEKRRTGRQESR